MFEQYLVASFINPANRAPGNYISHGINFENVVLLTRLRCQSQSASLFHFVAYIMWFQVIIIYKIPPGEEGL